jgi:acyl carrier protein
MMENAVYTGLQSVFNAVFRRADLKVTPQLTARDVPGWDSFRYISIIAATEEHFGIQFEDADIEDLKNVGDLAAAVARRMAAKAGPP